MVDKILIKNALAIITCNAQNDIHYNSDLYIEGPEIIKIGKNLEAGDARIIDGKNMFVYPGLINTHHHFFQAFVRNNVWLDWTKLDVMDWIKQIYEFFKLIDSDSIYYTSLSSMSELIKHGCTTAFDHQYCYPKHAGKLLVDRQMEAAELLGMRFHAGRGTNTLPRSKGSIMPDEMVETTDEFLKDCDRLISKYHQYEKFGMKRIVVAPCQPVNCYPETFSESVKLARSKKVSMHTHLGEGEDPIIVERYGKRSLEWCEDLGFVGPDVWYAHGWDLQDEEIDLLAKIKTGVSHCPAPAFLGGFNVLNIPRFYAKNVPLGLGVDGHASNDNSNLMEIIRTTYLLQCHAAGQRDLPIPPPQEFLKMATAGGAKLLNRDDIGILEEGKAADMFLLDTRKLEYVGTLHDPASLPVKVGISEPVTMTIINGKVVYEDGHLNGINESVIFDKAQETCKKVIYSDSNYKLCVEGFKKQDEV